MIFEYWKDGANIEKLVFRASFDTKQDLIFVLTQDKRILTVYFNQKQDNHKTLNPSNYALK